MLVLVTTALVAALMINGASSSYMCSRRWRNVLEHDSYGTPIYGSKEVLYQAAMAGTPIRVYLRDNDNNEIIVNDDKVGFLDFQSGKELCIESLKHIKRDSWKSFNNRGIWQFFSFCSDGYLQNLEWEFGHNVSSGDARSRHPASWYVQFNGCKDGEGNLLLTTYANGTKADGDVETLAMAVVDGASLSIFDESSFTRLPMTSLHWAFHLVVGYNQFTFSDAMVGSHRQIESWPSWLFNLWTTDGIYRDVHWKLRSNSFTRTNATKTLKWFADPCWQLAYSHDGEGNAYEGSLEFLNASVVKGHRVKVLMANFSTECDDVIIERSSITCIITSDVTHSRADNSADFRLNVNWLFRIVSTTGANKYHMFDVLNPESHFVVNDHNGVTWFVDTKPWKHVYSVSANGATLHGSKQELITAARNGADVRIAWNTPGFWSVLQKADTVIINGTELAAESIRSLFVTRDAQDGFVLPRHPEWTYSIATTGGEADTSRWRVGTHQSTGHFQMNANVDWFINL